MKSKGLKRTHLYLNLVQSKFFHLIIWHIFISLFRLWKIISQILMLCSSSYYQFLSSYPPISMCMCWRQKLWLRLSDYSSSIYEREGGGVTDQSQALKYRNGGPLCQGCLVIISPYMGTINQWKQANSAP